MELHTWKPRRSLTSTRKTCHMSGRNSVFRYFPKVHSEHFVPESNTRSSDIMNPGQVRKINPRSPFRRAIAELHSEYFVPSSSRQRKPRQNHLAIPRSEKARQNHKHPAQAHKINRGKRRASKSTTNDSFIGKIWESS
jgi:hypothetical protein